MDEHAHTQNNPNTHLTIPASETAERMANACANFLEALTPALRQKAEFPFADTERLRWHFVPVELWERKGVPLKEMNDAQRNAAFKLLACGLSNQGYRKAKAIINLEPTLGEIERAEGDTRFPRDPEQYFFSVFGDPTNNEPWGWRAEGHHVSLHFTVINREFISPNPCFFGSNPAEVRHGANKGLRILSAEEDLARQLLGSLKTDQRGKAVINPTAPPDILTREQLKVEVGAVQGLAAESMETPQRELLVKLIHEYVERLPQEIADIEIRKLRDANLNDIHFAWAGAEERGKPHYYRLHGPFFFAEYDNTQNSAHKGLRILSAEEDLARQLLGSLKTDQRGKTVINPTAPPDILTREQLKVEVGAVQGLAAESMETPQRELLVKLIHEYVERLPQEIADIEIRKLRDANLNDIHFAWAGAEERGKPHYYRLHGPFFFAEYDNTQNNANHIHTVWRHMEDDFGFDLLRLHYQHAEPTKHHQH